VRSLPKVSIVTISYNQEEYIGAALQSFVEQETDFAIEVIVADDCSTDRTPEIIDEYAKRYPDIFRPLRRKANLGIQRNIKDALMHARGTYIALCEGDDYWTDPTKLQRQVDFMEAHPDYALCFHPVRVFFQNQEEPDSIYPEPRKGHRFSVGELLSWNFIQTNSVLYRRQSYDALPEKLLPLDWYLHLYHAQFGKIGFIDRVMGAYRRHAGGIWWSSHENVDQIWRKHGASYLGTYKEILKIYGYKPAYRATTLRAIDELFEHFIAMDERYEDTILVKMAQDFPEDVKAFIIRQSSRLKNTESSLRSLESAAASREHDLAELRQLILQKNELIEKQSEEIRAIKASKVWRARNKVARTIGRKVV
jgi:glycosyltransferase involved in cell wall biosynthesis